MQRIQDRFNLLKSDTGTSSVEPKRPAGRGSKLLLRPYIWIVPAMAMLATFLFYPIFFTTTLSLFEYNGYTRGIFVNFVGLDNYIELVQDRLFLKALYHTLLVVFFGITVQIAVALLLAVFIYMAEFRAASWLRGIIFFPSVLSAIVVATVWRNIVFLRGGLISQYTTAFGLPDFFPLGDPKYAIFALIIVSVWQGVGFNLVIFYAGLQSLESEVVESAQIDGVNFWQMIRRIVVPLQAHVILVSVVLNVIGGVQVFDLFFVLIKGHLAAIHAADVLATYMMLNSFAAASVYGGRSALGFAASIAVTMMLMMLGFAVLRTRLRKAIDY